MLDVAASIFVHITFEFPSLLFLLFKTTSTTQIYTLSLHDALPILIWCFGLLIVTRVRMLHITLTYVAGFVDRKSTRLNSSHVAISYAVFCLKKKKEINDLN